MEGHVAVVVQLAQRDAQPVGVADERHRVGLQAAQLADPHAGAGQDLDGHPPADHCLVGQGPHELGEAGVVQEAGKRLVALGDVAEEDRRACRGVVPAPLDDAHEERAQLAEAPAEGCRLEPPGGPRLGPLPELERLDVGPLDVGHAGEGGILVDEEPGEDAKVGIDRPGRGRPHGHADLGHVGHHGFGQLRRRGVDGPPRRRHLGRRGDAGQRRPGPHRATRRAWASMAAAALRYSAASQSSARWRYTRVVSMEAWPAWA